MLGSRLLECYYNVTRISTRISKLKYVTRIGMSYWSIQYLKCTISSLLRTGVRWCRKRTENKIISSTWLAYYRNDNYLCYISVVPY